jgi:hypothetical protein
MQVEEGAGTRQRCGVGDALGLAASRECHAEIDGERAHAQHADHHDGHEGQHDPTLGGEDSSNGSDGASNGSDDASIGRG